MPCRPSNRRPISGGLAALALLLAACGDDDPVDTASDDTAVAETDNEGTASSTPEGPDGEASHASDGACGMIPEGDIVAALAEPTSVVHDEASGASLEMCEWQFPADEDAFGLPPTLQLVLLGADDYESRTAGGEGLYEEVPGLGDEAVWAFSGMEETGYMAQLLVRDGDEGIHLNAAGLDFTDEAEARDVFVSFAEAALGA